MYGCAQTEDEMTRRVKLFLSCVSDEFAAHRKLLEGDLKRPDLDVAVQEHFLVTRLLARLIELPEERPRKRLRPGDGADDPSEERPREVAPRDVREFVR